MTLPLDPRAATHPVRDPDPLERLAKGEGLRLAVVDEGAMSIDALGRAG